MTDLSGDITSLLGTWAPWALAAMAAGSVVVARPVQRRWFPRRPVVVVWSAIVAVAVVVAFTLLRDGLPSRLSLGAVADWSTSMLDALATDPLASSQVVLNVLLFVPLGAAVMALLRRPLAALACAAGVSVAVELLQAITGAGANDIGDVIANVLGAAAGVGLAAILLRVGRRTEARPPAARVVMVAAGVGLTVVLMVVAAVLTADANRDDVHDALKESFRGTTLADARAWEANGEAESKIFSVIDERSDGQRLTASVREQRYPATRFGVRRCVFVVWTDEGVAFRDASGSECTRFIDSDVLIDGTWTPPPNG